jgi:hypothetical protein
MNNAFKFVDIMVSVAVYVGALALAGIVVNNAMVWWIRSIDSGPKGLGYYRAVACRDPRTGCGRS